MSSFTDASGLVFFKCENYIHGKGYVFDASLCPRPHYCMGFVLEGKGVFTDSENGESVTVSSGDIIFVPMGSRYVARWENEGASHYVSMHFVFECSDIFPQKNRYRFCSVKLDDTKKTKDVFLKMLAFSQANDIEKLTFLGDFYALLSQMLPQLSKKEALPTDSRLEMAIEYIEKNYREKISVEALAQASQMSVSRFFPYFKRALGVTPIDYVNNYRVSQAIILLMNGEGLSVEEISETVGFESSAYFRRVFKKTTGHSPRRYRSTAAEM